MNKYEKLRSLGTSKTLPDDFKAEFESALSEAIGRWQKKSKTADSLEDEPMELSFAKGFLAGCIYAHGRVIEKLKTIIEED